MKEKRQAKDYLLGGLVLAGGDVEMLGAGAMYVVPEPTMLTKASCVIVAPHSLTTIQASVRQINTDTYNSAVTLPETLAADKGTALKVGFTVGIAIPKGWLFKIELRSPFFHVFYSESDSTHPDR